MERHADTPNALRIESSADQKTGVLSVVEYRRLTRDSVSTDDQISKRLEYLEMLCRDVIKRELGI